ncbi:hypothetical protein Pfo_021844 [Paulownia fortunei]|nr:hypothetical protein Pfo_021844 [Paulownia fortunei]
MAKSWEEQADLARSCLEKTHQQMKKWADERRLPQEFNIGNPVLVKLLSQQFKALPGLHKDLVRRYEGPFPIMAKVGKVSYHVDLPNSLKIHPVFHVRQSHWAPPMVTKSYNKEIEEVFTKKTIRQRGVQPCSQYLIKWKGLPKSEVTWEPKEDLWQFQDQLREYEAMRASPN